MTVELLVSLVVSTLTIISSVVASTGFWAYITKKNDQKSAQTRLLISPVGDKITNTAIGYITRGYITKDEYSVLKTQLYEPYIPMGGNGTAQRIMLEIERLPMKEKE